MNIPTFHTYDSLESARDEWLAIESTAISYPFQRYHWLEAWQRTLGDARGVRPLIVVVEGSPAGGKALLPLGFWREKGMLVMGWLGAGVSDYRNALFAGEFESLELLDLTMRLARQNGADLVHLDQIPGRLSDGKPNPLVGGHLHRLHYMAHSLTLPIDFGQWLEQRTSPKERYNHRRAEKKLGEIGHLEFVVAKNKSERESFTEAMIGQKRERYRSTGVADLFEEAAFAQFYHLAAASDDICPHISALLLDGKPIATHWGMADSGSAVINANAAYFLMPTFEGGELGRHSPGLVFLLHFIEHLAEAKKQVRLDFTIGDEGYKEKWCDEEMSLYSWHRGISLRGRVAAAVDSIVEKLKDGPALEMVRRLRKWRQRRRGIAHLGRQG